MLNRRSHPNREKSSQPTSAPPTMAKKAAGMNTSGLSWPEAIAIPPTASRRSPAMKNSGAPASSAKRRTRMTTSKTLPPSPKSGSSFIQATLHLRIDGHQVTHWSGGGPTELDNLVVGFIHTIASLPIPRDVEREEDQVCADDRSDDCSDEGEKSAGRIEPQPGTYEAASCCCRNSDGVA